MVIFWSFSPEFCTFPPWFGEMGSYFYLQSVTACSLRGFFRKAEAKQVSLDLNIYEKEMLAGKFLCVRVKHALNQ